MRLLKKIFVGILFLLLLLLGMLSLVFYTTTGLRVMVNGIVHFFPGLEISSVSGSWADLIVKGFRYQTQGITMGTDELHLAVDFGCFRHRHLCINNLSLNNVSMKINTSDLGKSPAKMIDNDEYSVAAGMISIPYPLILRRMAMNNLHIKVNNTTITVKKLRTGLIFRDNQVVVMPTRIAGLFVGLSSTVMPILIPDLRHSISQFSSHYSWSSLLKIFQRLFRKPLLPSFIFPLNITFEKIEGVDFGFYGVSGTLINRLSMQAVIRDQHAELIFLNIHSSQGALKASGTVDLRDQWPVSLRVNSILNIDPLKGEKITLTIGGDLRDELRTHLIFDGPVSAKFLLKTCLTKQGLPITLSIDSAGVQWPLGGTPSFLVEGITLRLNGVARDYRLVLTAGLRGVGIPPANLDLHGKGNTEGFTLSLLRLRTLGGYTDLSAVLDWRQAISWKSELIVDGINIARQWPNWPVQLEGKIIAQGNNYAGNWKIWVPKLNLSGNINQNFLSLTGSLSRNKCGQWKFSRLSFLLGGNAVEVNGYLKEKFFLDAIFNAPSLNGVLPGLGGRVQGSIKLRGDPKVPQVLLDLTSSLSWTDFFIHRMSLQGKISFSDMIYGNVYLQIDQLRKGAISLHQLIVAGMGNERRHQVKLVMHGSPVAGQVQFEGSFDRVTHRWHSQFSQIYFFSQVGEWRLIPDVVLDHLHRQKKSVLSPNCWKNLDSKICVPQNIQGGSSGWAIVQLNSVDSGILKFLLPKDTQVSGVFSGRADVCWGIGGKFPQVKMMLVGNQVQVTKALQEKTFSVLLDTLTLNANLDKGIVRIHWLTKIFGNGQFKGSLEVEACKNQRDLSGHMNLNNFSLALLKPLLMSDESIDGLLNLDLKLGGNIYHPQLYGKVEFERLVIKGNFMPFEMRDSWLVLTCSGTTSEFQGLMNTTQGQVNLIGNADWSRVEAWSAHIAARGGNWVRIRISPMVWLNVSPDIIFEASPGVFSLKGKIDIPSASIEVKVIPSTVVGIASDEVLLDDFLNPVKATVENILIPMSIQLFLHVGDDVQIDAFGLQAKLKGDIKLAKHKKGLGLHGQIDIASGRFYAYGQDLIVNKGKLLFSGPVDQPYLDIEAIRNPDATEDNVIVGVRVTGFLDDSRFEVFSEPAKSQQETIFYLLRGQRFNVSVADNNMMTLMLIGMGVSQTEQFLGKVGEVLGISGLVLHTQGVAENSRLVLSGYISPGLQVKYGVGIFDSVATLTLRYRLMSTLYLEVASGLDQTLDLLYRFEF